MKQKGIRIMKQFKNEANQLKESKKYSYILKLSYLRF